jgi:hypothetical protein
MNYAGQPSLFSSSLKMFEPVRVDSDDALVCHAVTWNAARICFLQHVKFQGQLLWLALLIRKMSGDEELLLLVRLVLYCCSLL